MKNNILPESQAAILADKVLRYIEHHKVSKSVFAELCGIHYYYLKKLLEENYCSEEKAKLILEGML